MVLVDAGTGGGSGIVISNTEILTAEHIITGSASATVSIDGVGLRTATVYGYDSQRDIALLRLIEPAVGATIAEINAQEEPVDTGDPVVAIGFTDMSATSPTITFGYTSGRTYFSSSQQNIFRFDAIVNPGDSGGGVFDRDGQLVGLILGRHSTVEAVSYAARLITIREVLPALRQGTKR
ncbi:MAG: serine protease [Chloroflexota bacterium]|nr:serine protease [Chloroflexota bacterium]